MFDSQKPANSNAPAVKHEHNSLAGHDHPGRGHASPSPIGAPSGEVSTGRLFATMTLNFIITIAEVIGGIVSGSLSLLSDALHNFSDGVSIIVSYIALKLSRKPQTLRYTFGLKRAEILAAVLNAGTLIGICIYLFKESYDRLVRPEPINGGVMIAVASIGLVANIAGTILLHRGAKGNINIRSAYLHLLSDAISSAAVIIGGLAIVFLGVHWLDPILTVLISIYILRESLEIIKQAVNVLMMGAPDHLSIESIQQDLENLPGVLNIHHVHIWRLNEQNIHFEAHVEVEDMPVSDTHAISRGIEHILKSRHGVNHVTLQFEAGKCQTRKLI